jgi:putative DNA primase/helicase
MAGANYSNGGVATAAPSIPAELRERAQWVCWRFEMRDGKATKVPFTPLGRMASSTDPASWFDFETCSTASGFDGAGYVFSAEDQFVGLDFDNCFTDGILHPEVAALVLALDSYTEVSPSGNGIKSIIRATKGDVTRCRTSKTAWSGEFECYDQDRYFTITGAHLNGTPTTIEARQPELELVLARVFGEPKPAVPIRAPASGQGFSGDDRELVELASRARNGAKFERLWNGDTSGHADDDSAADMALCGLLAFWTGCDPTRIDRLFRMSGLMRDKWDRDDYRERTITKAIEECTDVYYERGGDVDLSEYIASVAASVDGAAGDMPPERTLRLRALADVRPRNVTWLLPGLIPLRTLSLVAGVGGLGKSTWLMGVAAKTSHGNLLDGVAADVIIVSFEDSAEETLRPRVEAAGGDLERVHEIVVGTEGMDAVEIPRDIDELRLLIRETGAKLIVFDPVVAAISSAFDTFKDQHVRLVLSKLAQIAVEEDCAVVLVGHLNKAPSTDAYLRIANSVAFWNASRSVILITEDPESPDDGRLLSHVKSNYGRIAPVERHRLEQVALPGYLDSGLPIETSRMVFAGIADNVTSGDALGPRGTADKELIAERFLRTELEDGEWHSSKEVKAHAALQNMSERTLQRAREALEVEVKTTSDFPAMSLWRLA